MHGRCIPALPSCCLSAVSLALSVGGGGIVGTHSLMAATSGDQLREPACLGASEPAQPDERAARHGGRSAPEHREDAVRILARSCNTMAVQPAVDMPGDTHHPLCCRADPPGRVTRLVGLVDLEERHQQHIEHIVAQFSGRTAGALGAGFGIGLPQVKRRVLLAWQKTARRQAWLRGMAVRAMERKGWRLGSRTFAAWLELVRAGGSERLHRPAAVGLATNQPSTPQRSPRRHGAGSRGGLGGRWDNRAASAESRVVKQSPTALAYTSDRTALAAVAYGTADQLAALDEQHAQMAAEFGSRTAGVLGEVRQVFARGESAFREEAERMGGSPWRLEGTLGATIGQHRAEIAALSAFGSPKREGRWAQPVPGPMESATGGLGGTTRWIGRGSGSGGGGFASAASVAAAASHLSHLPQRSLSFGHLGGGLLDNTWSRGLAGGAPAGPEPGVAGGSVGQSLGAGGRAAWRRLHY